MSIVYIEQSDFVTLFYWCIKKIHRLRLFFNSNTIGFILEDPEHLIVPDDRKVDVKGDLSLYKLLVFIGQKIKNTI